MIILSEKWGEIKYEAEDVYSFEYGIPGFEHLREYLIIPIEETPFYCMQSVTDSSISFILANPFTFFQTYEFKLDEAIKNELSVTSEEVVDVYNIVKIPKRLEAATINLAAPIILHNVNKKGKQYILNDSNYKVSQLLFQPLTV